ncbi:DNA helicase RecD, partial [Streptomyces laculatispora]|nr:DNA helicase RecD [Streptomyces laculatispora]
MTALPRGESPGPSATDDDSVVADATAPSPAEEAAAGTAEATGAATDDGETAAATGATDTDGTDEASAGPDPADATDEGPDGDAAAGGAGSAEGDTPAAPALSEAEVELAAQRELLERIEKRKAEKDGPIPAGTKLSGPAADLLAAVRAVESGEKPGAAFFDSPAPAVPRRPVPGLLA